MIPKSCRLFGQRSWAKSKRAEREANQAHSKLGASVARCPRTPPDAAKTPGLQIGLSNRLRGLSNRSIVVVCNYCSGPITAEPYRAKARPLRPRRSCFAPMEGIGGQRSERLAGSDPRPLIPGIGGGAGYCPRVRKVYYDGHLSP